MMTEPALLAEGEAEGATQARDAGSTGSSDIEEEQQDRMLRVAPAFASVDQPANQLWSQDATGLQSGKDMATETFARMMRNGVRGIIANPGSSFRRILSGASKSVGGAPWIPPSTMLGPMRLPGKLF
jgi:hypothetical protein